MAAQRRNILIASLVGGAIFAAATLASATPVTPPPGATVRTAHPVFTWTLPANEGSLGIFIANSPATTDGAFPDQNVVDTDVVTFETRKWSPSHPLYAGHYWWNVWSTDLETEESFYSSPTDFTIPVALRLYGVTAKRFSSPRRRLWVVVRASANVKRPLVRIRLLHGGRIVWKAARKAYGNIIPGAINFYWYPGRGVKPGTRLRLVTTISAGGITRTRSLIVRAP